VYSVACLEVAWVDCGCSTKTALAYVVLALALETLTAKEARTGSVPLRKSPRLFVRGCVGIKVRTKWQSSTADGDTAGRNVKGNRHAGDGWCFGGKTCST